MTAGLVAICALSCSRSDPGQPLVNAVNSSKKLRIVSLSPAISRTLLDFGLADSVVGRSPHCYAIDQAIPVVGDLVNIDYERLIRVQPTHVLVQPPSSGIDSHLLELAQQHGWSVGQWRLSNVEDINQLVRELPETLYATDEPNLERASSRAAELLNEIAAALSPGDEDGFHGRVLLVHSVDAAGGMGGVGVFGTGTYLHDVLSSVAATNAITHRGWVTLSLEDVVRINPQAIIIVRPAKQVAGDARKIAGPLADMNIEAVSSGRIAVLAHPDAFTPSSGIVEVAAQLRRILVQWR